MLDAKGHPVAAALANIISKCASLFDYLTNNVYFTAVATSLAEFLISEKVKLNRNLAIQYVRCVEKQLDNADLNDAESILQAYVDGYLNYLSLFEFEFDIIVDKLLQVFASQLIVLSDRMKS